MKMGKMLQRVSRAVLGFFALLLTAIVLIVFVYCFGLWQESRMPTSWYLKRAGEHLALTLLEEQFEDVYVNYRSGRDVLLEINCTVKDADRFEALLTEEADTVSLNDAMHVRELYPILSEEVVSKLQRLFETEDCIWILKEKEQNNRTCFDLLVFCNETREMVYVGLDAS